MFGSKAREALEKAKDAHEWERKNNNDILLLFERMRMLELYLGVALTDSEVLIRGNSRRYMKIKRPK